MAEGEITAFFDGGCRNAGGIKIGGGGWIVFGGDRLLLDGRACFYEDGVLTNNVCELRALHDLLVGMQGLGVTRATVIGDS